MPDVYGYSSDPGKEVRTSRGSVINLVRETQRSPEANAGVSVLGVIGTPANDRGVPGVPVVLSGVQDIFSRWGGFLPHVGDGAADGYNGNVAALLWSLLALRVVFQPVDMALKDATYATGVDTKLRLTRTFSVTGEADDETLTADRPHGLAVGDAVVVHTVTGGASATWAVPMTVATVPSALKLTLTGITFSSDITVGTLAPLGTAVTITGLAATDVLTTNRAHGLQVGDTVVISGLTGGSGAAAGVFVVASVPSTTTLTLTAFAFTTDITAGTLTPPGGAAHVVPAGTQFKDPASDFIVRTVEAGAWVAGDQRNKDVRVSKVSGTVANLNLVTQLQDSLAAPSARVSTPSLVPVDMTAGEILIRYQAAIDAFNVNAAGLSATVMITDRTEAGINDALTSHCVDAASEGVFRVAVIAPPIGTSIANAEATTGDGVGRASLNGDYAIYVHPGIRRRFPLDSDNLSAADDYKATFPAHALLAAKMLNARPEENPTYPEAEPGATYGVAELELSLTREEKVTHFQAGIATTVLEKISGRRVAAWRDGIMASGVKIARKRLEDFLAQGLIERLTPWHKRLASTANQEGAVGACETWLLALEDLNDQRIAGHAITVSWDGDTSEFTVQADVVELGNLDIITVKIGVTASGFTVLEFADAA